MRRRPAVVAVAVAAGLALSACAPAPSGPAPLVPGLDEALPTLDAVTIEQGGQAFAFRRDGAQWRIDGAAWRADRRWLQPLLLNLAGARCDEPRTADPARFERIGVAWPPAAPRDEGGAFALPTGRLALRVGDATHRIVIGHPHARGGTFVRVEGAPHSCLTRADLRLPAQAAGWFDPRLWAGDVPVPARIVVEDPGASPLVLQRDGERYRAEGQALALSPLPDALASALVGLRQQDRRPATDRPVERTLRFETPAGDGYAVALRREEARTWARVLAAPAAQGDGFEGREFLLPPDVADPLWASRESLGAPR